MYLNSTEGRVLVQYNHIWHLNWVKGIVFDLLDSGFSLQVSSEAHRETDPMLETFSSDVVDSCLAGWGYSWILCNVY